MRAVADLICQFFAIAAPCAGRTVPGVIAIGAHLGGTKSERKRSRQLQCGFEATVGSLSRDAGVRRCELGARTVDCFRGDARGPWCTHHRRCGSQLRGRKGLSHALPPAVFPHPGRSLCWITIRHSFSTQTRAPVYRAPANGSAVSLHRWADVFPQKANYLLVCGALHAFSMTD